MIAFILCANALIASASGPKNVHVSMTANFDSVPLLFEIAEFFHDHHQSNKEYFDFIDSFIDYYHPQCTDDVDSAGSCPSQQSIYEWTIASAQKYGIGRIAMESLEFALSLHHYTPRTAMFEQLYQQQNTDTGNKRLELISIQSGDNSPHLLQINDAKESIQQIRDILDNVSNDSAQNLNWQIFKAHDHWIGNSCFEDQSVLIIYYGDYLSNTFGTIYKFLISQTNTLCFVLRPISLIESLTEFNLQGYGVELAIKNMEYSVIDDRNIANVQVDIDGNVHNVDDNDASNHIFHETLSFITSILPQNASSNALLEMEEEIMKTYMNEIDIQSAKAMLMAYEYAMDSNTAEKDVKFLSIFREFSTNIPRYVQILSHLKSDIFAYLMPYLQIIQRYQREGQQTFSLNGINLAVSDFDIFSFYNTLHKEAKFVDILNEIMIDYESDFSNNGLLNKLLSTPFVIGLPPKQSMGGMGMFGMASNHNLKEEEVRIDMRDRAFLKQYKSKDKNAKVIAWINNIERDKRYKKYYRDLQPLKSFMVMQQIVPIQKNMYHGIAIFDPIEIESFAIFHAIQNGVEQGLPLHFGYILFPNLSDDVDETKRFLSKRIMQCVVWLLNESKSAKGAKQSNVFLSNLYSPIIDKQNGELEQVNSFPSERDIEDAILEFIDSDKKKKKQSVLNEIYDYDISHYLKLTSAFLEEKGMISLLQQQSDEDEKGCLFALNGRIFPHISGDFNVYSLIGILMEEQRSYLMSYSMGKITKRTNFNNYVYEKPDVLPRFSKFLSWFNNANTPNQIKTNDDVMNTVSNKTLTVLHPNKLKNINANVLDDMYWDNLFVSNSDSNAHVITAWIIVDIQTQIGRFLLDSFSKINTNFEQYAVDDNDDDKLRPFGLRFAVFFNSESDEIFRECVDVNKASCVDETGPFSWQLFAENTKKCASADVNAEKLTSSKLHNMKIFKYLVDEIGLESNENYIILNGEVIPFDHLLNDESDKNPITTNDIWSLISRYNEEINPLMNTLFNDIDGIYQKEQQNEKLYDAIMRIVNLLYYRRLHEGFKSSQSLFSLAENDETLRTAVDSLSIRLTQNDDDGAPFLIRCVLDPLSPQTQRIVSFLDELYHYHNLFDIEICFNPILEMKDEINRYGFPKKLSRFYRYVFNPNNFINGVDEDVNAKAIFSNMPSDDVLTMGITDAPGTWLYESLICMHDLDNLLLSKIDSTQSSVLSVNYHLSMLILQGQCFDEKQSPVPGLQLELRNRTHLHDATIAMQTLGYWQLKANPGVWELGLREGRTTEVMDIDINKTQSDDALIVKSDDDEIKMMVVLNSFTRAPFRLITKHKKGMEKEELLPQLTEEQIEAEEQRRIKEKMDKQKKKKKKKKQTMSKEPESESSKQDSTGSIFSKLKNLVLGDKKTENKEVEIEEDDDEDEEEDDNPLSQFFQRPQKPEKYVAPTPQIRIDAKPDKETTLHVMSVASGHLYERFLKV